MSTITTILNQKLKGKNLSKIARELSIPKSLLADWVASRRLPSLKNIEAIAKLATYLDLSLEELLLGNKKEHQVISEVKFEDETREYKVHIVRIR